MSSDVERRLLNNYYSRRLDVARRGKSFDITKEQWLSVWHNSAQRDQFGYIRKRDVQGPWQACNLEYRVQPPKNHNRRTLTVAQWIRALQRDINRIGGTAIPPA